MWRALVLRGGGVSVEFQVGLLGAMAEVIPHVDFYAGTGLGALSAAVLAQYDRLDHGALALQRLWDSIESEKDVIDTPWQGVTAAMATALATNQSWAPDSICGNGPLLRLIEGHVSWDRLSGKANWGVPVASLSDGHPYPVTNHPTVQARLGSPGRLPLTLVRDDGIFIGDHVHPLIAAACSTPLIMPPVNVGNHRLVTGQMLGLSAMDLAVEACRNAVGSDLDGKAEILVIENSPVELQAAGPSELDSGREIALRALRMWSGSQLAAELGKAQNRFSGYPNVHFRLVRPQLDHGLHPMQFGESTVRRSLRHHGAARAVEVFGHRKSQSRIDKEAHQKALSSLRAAPTDTRNVKQVAMLTRQDPAGARAARDRLKRELEQGAMDASEVADATAGASAVTDTVREAAEFIEEADVFDTDRPQSFQELVKNIQYAVMTGTRIKAVGAGFAFDNIIKTTGRRIEMDDLNEILEVDRTTLNTPELADQLFRFEAGATVEQINRALWTRGKALLNQPGYEKLSFAGAMSVGGHGSGIRIGPLASQVRSLRLVTVDEQGQVVHRCIEPENGAITDVAKFSLAAPGVELVQDDDVFNAVVSGLGCLGVIYSVTVEVRDLYFLEETRRLTTWEALTSGQPSQLQTLLDDEDVHSVHVWLNPYEVDGSHTVVVSEYREHPGPARGQRGYGITWSLVDELAPLLLALMELIPASIPGMLDESLESVVPNGQAPVLPCYEALNFGTPNDVDVIAAACGVPVEKTKEAGDLLIQRFTSRAEHGAYITSPIGLRFVASTSALLAMQHQRDTCMIELPLLEGTDHARGTLDVFHTELRVAFGGRPHWGQINRTLDGTSLKQLYPKPSLDTFLEVFCQYNPLGLFDNEFTEDLELRDLANCD